MNGFERKEPYFHIKIEGDYTNWAAAGFPGLGLNHNKLEVTETWEESVKNIFMRQRLYADLRL